MPRILYPQSRGQNHATVPRFVKCASPASRIPSATSGALTATSQVAVSSIRIFLRPIRLPYPTTISRFVKPATPKSERAAFHQRCGASKTAGTALLLVVLLCLSLLPASAHAGILSRPVNNLGLVGYWPLDEGTGTTARDVSGGNNPGTLQNSPTWTTGQIAGALNFVAASSQYVDMGISSTLSPSSAITVSAWINASSFPNAQNDVVERGVTNFYELGVTSTGKMSIWVALNAVNSHYSGTGTYTLLAGKWYHVAFTYDSVNGLKGYVNGLLDGSDVAFGTMSGSNHPFTIGAFTFFSNRYFNGKIDDVRVYNRALSATDIARLYTAGRTTRDASPTTLITNGLVGYWTFDGHNVNWGSNTTADSSGQGNTGTLINMSTSTSGTIGKIGQALSFNSSAHVQLQNSTSLNLNGSNLTMAAWIKPQTLPAGDHIFLIKSANSDGNVSRWFLDASANHPRALAFNGSFSCTITGSTVLSVGTWYHVAATFDGNALRLYVNGVQDSSLIGGVCAGATVDAVANYFTISPTGFPFTGAVDDVRIYNRALSATEIQQLYQAGGGVIQDASNPQALTGGGLVGHWSFDGKYMNWATNQALDSSGQGNNGTLVNMSTTTSPTRGVIGQALQFNGTNQYISTLNFPPFTSAFTLSAWVYANNTGNYKEIIAKSLGSGATRNDGELRLTPGTQLLQLVGIGGTPVSASDPVPFNKWTYVTGTFDGTNSRVYINGVLEGSSASITYSGQASDPLYIGLRADLFGYFPGTIDDVRIYNRALTAQEVQTLYALGR